MIKKRRLYDKLNANLACKYFYILPESDSPHESNGNGNKEYEFRDDKILYLENSTVKPPQVMHFNVKLFILFQVTFQDLMQKPSR